jgi:hypothetical protein
MYEVLAAAGLAGDYNENDVIDAADYVVWRDAMTAGLTSLSQPRPLQFRAGRRGRLRLLARPLR